jgi:outer membrane protein assembly factor BamB
MIKQLLNLFIGSSLLFISACVQDSDSNVVWKFRTGYPITSDPVAANGRIYFGSDKFYCLDAKTGDQIWDFKTYSNVQTIPVYKNNRIYFQCGGLYCLDAKTGKLIWEFWADQWGARGLKITDKNAYASAGKNLYCVNLETGKKIWGVKTDTRNPSFSASNKHAFILFKDYIFCLNSSDGKKVWKHKVGEKAVIMTAAQGNLYLGYIMGGKIYCLDEKTGKIEWEHTLSSTLYSLLAEKENMLFFASNKVGRIDIKTGNKVWETDFKTPVFRLLLQNSKYLNAQTIKKKTFCIDADTGGLLSSLQNKDEFPSQSTNYIYSGSRNYYLYCRAFNNI